MHTLMEMTLRLYEDAALYAVSCTSHLRILKIATVTKRFVNPQRAIRMPSSREKEPIQAELENGGNAKRNHRSHIFAPPS